MLLKMPRENPEDSYFFALSHSIRQEIFRLAVNREKNLLSPAEAARILGFDVSKTAYHMKVLRNYALMELIDEVQNGGTVEHFYRPVEKAVEHPVIASFLKALPCTPDE
jgi:hypothetical protein